MITQAQLKRRLVYNPLTGVFTWLTNSSRWRHDLGKQAGYFEPSTGGRIRIVIDGKRYYASHLAFLYMTGEWPPAEIPHRNHNAAGNSWSISGTSHFLSKTTTRASDQIHAPDSKASNQSIFVLGHVSTSTVKTSILDILLLKLKPTKLTKLRPSNTTASLQTLARLLPARC
jgi:hypothetical protein